MVIVPRAQQHTGESWHWLGSILYTAMCCSAIVEVVHMAMMMNAMKSAIVVDLIMMACFVINCLSNVYVFVHEVKEWSEYVKNENEY